MVSVSFVLLNLILCNCILYLQTIFLRMHTHVLWEQLTSICCLIKSTVVCSLSPQVTVTLKDSWYEDAIPRQLKQLKHIRSWKIQHFIMITPIALKMDKTVLFVSLSESFKVLCRDYNTWWLQFIHKCRFSLSKNCKTLCSNDYKIYIYV